MTRVLIADPLAPEGLRILRDAGCEVAEATGAAPDALARELAKSDALIVRSGVQVTAELLASAKGRLKVVARAGVGTDNIDIDAATRAGILVLNTPEGNITSAAEHTWALLLALVRNVVPAHGSLAAGKWDRKGLLGSELEGKTLGVVGLGRVGARVAKYGQAFGMHVVAYDPFLTRPRAERLGVEVAERLPPVLERADVITLHVPLTDATRGLLGAAEFRLMKKGARLVNCARGGVVDEKALAEALRSKLIAGAALDVFEKEPPPKESPLWGAPNLLMTPHLGASTEEAQARVAVDAARQIVEFFKSGVVTHAVNLVPVTDPLLRAYMDLAEYMGILASALAGPHLQKLRVEVRGELAEQHDARPLTQAALLGVLEKVVGPDAVNLVNARIVAAERGVAIEESRVNLAANFRESVEVTAESEEGAGTVTGTLFDRREPRIVRFGAFSVDLIPAEHLLVLFYPDRPGVVGACGTLLGQRGVNIGRMEVGRRARGKQAVMILTLDDPVDDELMGKIRDAVGAEKAIRVSFPRVPVERT